MPHPLPTTTDSAIAPPPLPGCLPGSRPHFPGDFTEDRSNVLGLTAELRRPGAPWASWLDSPPRIGYPGGTGESRYVVTRVLNDTGTLPLYDYKILL